MFKIHQSPTYKVAVAMDVLVEAGTSERQEFTAVLARLKQHELTEFLATLANSDNGDAAVADRILVGWEGIVDDTGDPVPFTQNTKADLLDNVGLPTAITKAWIDSGFGSPRKN